MENKDEKLSSDQIKMKKLLLKNTKRAEKKTFFLKKMKLANPFERILIYFRHQFFNLLIAVVFFTVIFGFIGGSIARLIWEIWKMIFGLSL